MAERLSAALRTQHEIAELEKCKQEDDFAAMYGQPAEEQQRIRGENPRGTHCALLLGNPDACDRLPGNVGGGVKGGPCPANPYHLHRRQFRSYGLDRGFVDQCLHWFDMVELGIEQPRDLTPVQAVILRTVTAYHRSAYGFRFRF